MITLSHIRLFLEEIRDILEEAGLPPISAHVPEEYRPGAGRFSEVVESIVKIGRYCKQKNIVLLCRNHDFEFVKTDGGRCALDDLYETVSPELLQTEIDT